MNTPDPHCDALHPSGHILFRSCRGGAMHSIVLAEGAMHTDVDTLAQAILLTAQVSYLKAVVHIRQDIIESGHTPSEQMPTIADLDSATDILQRHHF